MGRSGQRTSRRPYCSSSTADHKGLGTATKTAAVARCWLRRMRETNHRQVWRDCGDAVVGSDTIDSVGEKVEGVGNAVSGLTETASNAMNGVSDAVNGITTT